MDHKIGWVLKVTPANHPGAPMDTTNYYSERHLSVVFSVARG